MLERLTARRLALVASLGSALLLAGAFAFQAAGYAPCELCILQRWPHLAAVIAAALIAALLDRGISGAQARSKLAALTREDIQNLLPSYLKEWGRLLKPAPFFG